ncbi:MAG: TetR/AcrR family transcriptional regulator [Maricaulaceae bacterium]|jgi:AcrR family transcriptional regulator
MRKGEATRETIVGEALSQAVTLGLEGVSLGPLADSLGLSKSGLYAHFKSKEALQLAVLDEAVERFARLVIAPAMKKPAGLARLRALFAGHLDWIKGEHAAGGCPFSTFVQEFDDRPGRVRTSLAASQKEWRRLLSAATRDAVRGGQLPSDLDADQVAFELAGAAMSYQVSNDLLDDRTARRRAMRAFERITSA